MKKAKETQKKILGRMTNDAEKEKEHLQQ